MIVTAPTGTSSTSFPPPESGYPPPPAPMVDSYPPPPPPTYYPAYGTGPPPPCYSHSPPSRSLAFIDAYQSCPCPMQSCPKNVLTGPLTGASKGSIKNHQTTPLPPVALALPLEPPGALGPPSPARGSAGMPPPPSPALATARNPTNGQWSESPPETTKPPVETKTETGLLAISKVLSESVMVAEQDIGSVENTIVSLSLPKTENIKIEVEDSVFLQESNEVKPNRKRKKFIKTTSECKKQITEVYNENTEIKMQMDIQERLKVPAEKLEKTVSSDIEKPVEKQLPLSDNGATVPVKKQVKKRKSTEEENQEPLPKVAKCEKSKVSEKPCDKVKKQKAQQVGKKKCVKRDKSVTEENIEPVETETVKVSAVAKVQNGRRNSKITERRKSSSPQENGILESPVAVEISPAPTASKKKKPVIGKKVAEKTKAEHTLRNQAVSKDRRNSKNGRGNGKGDTSPGRSTRKGTLLEENDSENLEALVTPAPRKVQLTPKWSNGWSWEGHPYKSKVFLSSDDAPIIRKCYPAMRHIQGDIICPRDCVLLKSGPRRTDLPFVAKVAAMWENPDDGEMMVSLLWYYRPEHTEQGRRPEDTPDEIFASRHKDTNSVACIEDKCFVLTYNEYCRYRKNVKRMEEWCTVPGRVVPMPDGGVYHRSERQPPGQVAPDLVFFCRRVYDFRQKRILKNPC